MQDYTRALAFQTDASVLMPSMVSQQTCAGICQRKGYTLSGVEAGSQCFCGTQVRGQHGAAAKGEPLADCSTAACAGDPAEQCGGNNRVLVTKLAGLQCH